MKPPDDLVLLAAEATRRGLRNARAGRRLCRGLGVQLYRVGTDKRDWVSPRELGAAISAGATLARMPAANDVGYDPSRLHLGVAS